MANGIRGDYRRFYLVMALICAAIVFVGFAPSYYLKNVFHAPPPLSALSTLHGVIFTAWVLLFVLQVALIGNGQASLHRKLGILGAVLFGVILTVGYSTSITAARLGHIPPGAPPALVFMALPIIGITGVAILVLLALANRSRSDFHMRLMLAGLIFMLPPALHRIAIGAGQIDASIWLSLGISDLLLLAAIGYDFLNSKRIHPAYLWSAAVFLVANIGVAWAFSSPHWLSFATWLTAL